MSIAPLTMIMGVGRSGTTALLRSLARDPRLSTFSEGEGPLYSGLYLRPEVESRAFLEQRTGPILTKPLNEATIRPVTEVLDEFAAYDPRLVWIYRDPVNVYHSWMVLGWTIESLLPFFLHEWNGCHRRLLTAMATHPSRITLIRYEDLILDEDVWRNTSERVFIEGESLFRPDSRAGRRLVSTTTQDVIDAETADIWKALEDARTFRARISRRLISGYGRGLIRGERRRRALGRSMRRGEAEAAVSAAGAGLTPDQVPSLHLWLDAGTLPVSADGSEVTEWKARSGASAVCGPGRKGARRRAEAVLGQPALFFPPVSTDDPDGGRGGFLCGPDDDWRFLFDGSEWTIIGVYRPIGKYGSVLPQAVLNVGDGRGGEAGLGVTSWGADVSAIMASNPAAPGQAPAVPVVVGAPLRAPGQPEAWRIVATVHHREDASPSGQTTISNYRGHRLLGKGASDPNRAYPGGAVSGGLHIGYTPGRSSRAFSGDLAELIVFSAALDDASRTAVVQYLGQKYGLT